MVKTSLIAYIYFKNKFIEYTKINLAYSCVAGHVQIAQYPAGKLSEGFGAKAISWFPPQEKLCSPILALPLGLSNPVNIVPYFKRKIFNHSWIF